jgi:hypothetical protein
VGEAEGEGKGVGDKSEGVTGAVEMAGSVSDRLADWQAARRQAMDRRMKRR